MTRLIGSPFGFAVGLCCLGGVSCTVGGETAPVPTEGVDAGTTDDARVLPETCDPSGAGSTLGLRCRDNAFCSDGCFCNGVERCDRGTCVAGADPCVDRLQCTRHQCVERVDRCFTLADDSLCQNGDACDGREVCDLEMGCRDVAPLDCNDGDSCTFDSCLPDTGCVHTPRDLDGDGFVAMSCGGRDCDDAPLTGSEVYPGAIEVCSNRRDDDCDGLRDYADTAECTPANDLCSQAERITASGIFSASTRGLRSNLSLECRSAAADGVYHLELLETRDLLVTVSGSVEDVGLSLRDWASCSAGPDLECTSTEPPVLIRRSLPPGEYALVVQTDDRDAFDLEVTLGEPTSVPAVNLCGPGTRDVSSGGSWHGFFSEVDDAYRLPCFITSPAKDVVHRLVLTGERDVTIRGATRGGSVTPATRLALVRECAEPEQVVQCAWSQTAEIRRRGLPPGTYYVVLESAAVTASEWRLDVDVLSPGQRVPGDSCADPLDVGNSPASIAWSEVQHDSPASCGQGEAFRDAYFSFELSEVRDVRVQTTSPGFHVAALATRCGSVSAELRCTAQTGSSVQTWRSLAPGRYFVTLASTAVSGTATVQVLTSPPTPVPVNDRCANAVLLQSGVSRSDSLVGFEDDVVGCYGVGRPDAIYRLRVDSPSTVDVIVSPQNIQGDVLLTLSDACGMGASLACDASPDAAVVSRPLSEGTYYVFVEASDPSAVGDFEIRSLVTPN